MKSAKGQRTSGGRGQAKTAEKDDDLFTGNKKKQNKTVVAKSIEKPIFLFFSLSLSLFFTAKILDFEA